MAILKNTTINDTGYLSLPVGTTAQRLSSAAGTLVYFTSVSTSQWTVPANVDSVEVLVVGGGGGGNGSPGGSNTQIQFNSGSVLSGSQYFRFIYASKNRFSIIIRY